MLYGRFTYSLLFFNLPPFYSKCPRSLEEKSSNLLLLVSYSSSKVHGNPSPYILSSFSLCYLLSPNVGLTPPGLTSQIPEGQMLVGGETDCGPEH